MGDRERKVGDKALRTIRQHVWDHQSDTVASVRITYRRKTSKVLTL